MSAVRLKYLARLNTDCEGAEPKPVVALENIDSWVGSLVDGVELPVKDPIATAGIATIEPGDVLFGKLRPYLAKTWLADRRAYASTELLCLRPASGVSSKWLAYLMSSRPVVDWAVATSDGTKMPRTSWEALGELRVTLPSESDQKRIAGFLERETARIDALVSAKRKIGELILEREASALSAILVPEGVRYARLGFFARLQTGLTVDAGRDSGPNALSLPYLRVANVQADRLDLAEITEVTVPATLAARSTLRPGDVLMTEGGDLDKLGRGTIWRGELPNCLHQNHIFAVRPYPERLDAEYLALLTRTAHARHYFETTGTRTTNLASTNSTKILGLPLPAITIEEQRRLVSLAKAALKPAQHLRSLLARQIELLHEHRQTLITAAVTGAIRVAGVAA